MILFIVGPSGSIVIEDCPYPPLKILPDASTLFEPINRLLAQLFSNPNDLPALIELFNSAFTTVNSYLNTLNMACNNNTECVVHYSSNIFQEVLKLARNIIDPLILLLINQPEFIQSLLDNPLLYAIFSDITSSSVCPS